MAINDFESARAARTEKRDATALDAYRKALADGQDTIGAILATAAVCLDMGDNKKARILLASAVILLPIERVEGRDPRAAEVYGMLGLAWARLGNLDEARHALAKSIAEDEGDFIASCPEAREASQKAWTFQ